MIDWLIFSCSPQLIHLVPLGCVGFYLRIEWVGSFADIIEGDMEQNSIDALINERCPSIANGAVKDVFCHVVPQDLFCPS